MKPKVIPRAQHPISRQLIDPDALKVMYRLVKSGYKAYLVGGGVRDLLLGRTPKDFDIGTDAHPNRIKKLFRNCRLVGRRFRLAHVHFGDNIIEVSTFRRRSEYQEQEDGDRLIRSDNTFGTPEEDAVRRDFTINGLFYDLETFSVLDYVGGIDDLEKRVIRSIGDPRVRLPEDPVRIIRVIKFAARLDFEVDPVLWKAMVRSAHEIHKCAKARVLEEIYRLLREGSSAAAFQLLHECGLLAELLPLVDAHLKKRRKAERDGDRVFWQYLETLDQLQHEGAELGNPLILGALAAHLVGVSLGENDLTEINAQDLTRAVDTFTRDWVTRLGVARRDRERLAHMLRAQPRFVRPRGRRFRPRAFVTKHYYPDAEALFALGSRATGLEIESLERWRALYQEHGENGVTEPPGSRRRRLRKREEPEAPPAEAAPKRKRGGRRRRRGRRRAAGG
jgi:poly(A) polymerase